MATDRVVAGAERTQVADSLAATNGGRVPANSRQVSTSDAPTASSGVGAAARPHIGELRERSLHAALKRWYALPNDAVEVRVGGYVVDLVRRRTLIEIQTRNFANIKRKLSALVEAHRVRLVYPIASMKWLLWTSADGAVLRRSRSPKRGTYHDVFAELIRIPHLVAHPNFSLEVLLVEVEETRCDDGQGSWRRRGVSVQDTRLLAVQGQRRYLRPQQLLPLVPRTLPEPFTSAGLAQAAGVRRALAGKMAYTLRHMGQLEVVGRQRQAYLYRRVTEPVS